LKVLHIELGRYMYGGAGQVKYLLEGLRRYPGENVLVCEQQSELAKVWDKSQGRVHTVRLGLLDEFDFRLVAQLRRIIAAERPDLVHVHCRRGDYFCALAARREGVPLLLSRRNDDALSAFDAKVKLPLFDRMIAISRAVKEITVAAGVPADRITIVSDGVDVTRFAPQCDQGWFTREFGLAPERKVLGMVASLIPRKGHMVLMDALPAILARHPDIYVLIFGKGRLEKDLRRIIAERGWQDQVRLEGYRSDTDRFLPCLDMLVHPAWREGMGVSILEAASCGVPVVASGVGGILDAIEDGVTGLLVKPGDKDGLAAAINRLLDEPETRRAFAGAGRARMVAQFSREHMVDGNYKVYQAFAADRAKANV
jgi:glycosyltransferase involved in cell wall biosynthesis